MTSPPATSIADAAGVLVAGGKSRRMGSEKARLPFAGGILADRPLALLRGLFSEVIVAAADWPLPLLPGERVVADRVPDAGPLAALDAASRAARAGWVFLLAVDMPFFTPDPVRALAKLRPGFRAVVVRDAGRLEPLAAFYARALLPDVEAALARRENALHGLLLALPGVRFATLAEAGIDPARARSLFANVNTKDEYHAARRAAPGEGAGATLPAGGTNHE
ncbi:MAG: molybdenum cofactor guanylyltransferase [Planctomycetes bacterium]|nr:molybdenum cofactor guanylyltransferase [Planctomycetota bacterium]